MHDNIKYIINKRILYLTKNPDLIEKQLLGENIKPVAEKNLLDKVSTDAYPTRACFQFDDQYMASQAFTGLKLANRWIKENEVKDNNFGVVVAGHSFGCGSSREHFPWSIKLAGIQLIVAVSIERIFAHNCQNIGLFYLTGDISKIIQNLIKNQGLPINTITKKLDHVSASIVKSGGLFEYYKKVPTKLLPKPHTKVRPMTASEKIIAKHMGVDYVKPGDSGFLDIDKRYSYEIFFPFSYQILHNQISHPVIKDKSSIFLYYDHSVLDNSLLALGLAKSMRTIAKKEKIKLYDGNRSKGCEGICHLIMIDKHIRPGEIVAGTDSHTCTLGAAGVLPIGVGATEWAAALWNKKVRIQVPSTLKIKLIGQLPNGVMAKDIMLYLLSLPFIKQGFGINKIFHFMGSALNSLPFEEQIVLTNMSVEGGAFTGFIEPNSQTIIYLSKHLKVSQKNLKQSLIFSDPGANYDEEITINLSTLEPYIALPGDPKNSLPLSKLLSQTKKILIQKAFIGSCTGGKYLDLLAAADILAGHKINSSVQLIVSPASKDIFNKAKKDGLIKIIEQAGGIIIPSACGACVNYGPGSVALGETGISSSNRNFPGRMGLGKVYLANPAIVAASAIAGFISKPENI